MLHCLAASERGDDDSEEAGRPIQWDAISARTKALSDDTDTAYMHKMFYWKWSCSWYYSVFSTYKGENFYNLDLVELLSLPAFIKVFNFKQKDNFSTASKRSNENVDNIGDTQDWVVVY